MTVRLCIAITETKYFNNRTISQKQSQFNAVFLTQKEMDRVGFEPTTSAMPMPYPTGLDDRPCYIQGFGTILK
jgi:hypothetical protein